MNNENPYGCPLNNSSEHEIAAAAIERSSNHLITGEAAKNLAYHVLSAVRHSHFNWKADSKSS